MKQVFHITDKHITTHPNQDLVRKYKARELFRLSGISVQRLTDSTLAISTI